MIDDDDVASVAAALRGELLTTGPLVERFEAALADVTGARHAVACNNGTSALYMAARALEIGSGDAVVVPAQTFLATASGPHLAGAEVVFADVDPETGLMRPADLERAIDAARRRFPTLRLRAAFVVHLNGQVADMPALKALCDSQGLALVEDAAHAVGGLARRAGDAGSGGSDSRVGDCRWSSMATFSFHPVKTIAMGEGGAVTTNDDVLAARLRRVRNHGMERDSAAWQHRDAGFGGDGLPNPWYYEMAEPSLNFRVPDILCALGISQLRKLASWVAERRRLFERYRHLLADVGAPVRPPATVTWGAPAWHLAAARIAFDASGAVARRDDATAAR
ncbi:MAG: aminotransferase class I/II-fold pyridoxal phosphate-dependent enzyme [Alphaproteobacteria bacterium]